MTNILKPLDKSVSIPLGLTLPAALTLTFQLATASEADAAIHNKGFG